MKKFPIITRIRPIEALSYWRSVRLRRCMLSGAYPASTELPFRPSGLSSRPQLLGQVFHHAMELFHELKGAGNLVPSSLRKRFFELIQAEEENARNSKSARHLADISSWPEIGEIYSSLMDLCERTKAASPEADSQVDVRIEETLYSSDRLLFGQIDAFFVRNEKIDLVDYKSGTLEDDTGLKSDYVDQLLFYAYLIDETYKRYPTSLMLKGRDSIAVEIEGSPAASLELANAMRAALAKFNRLVSEKPDAVSEFSSPEALMCSRCDAKIVCPAFWRDARTLGLENGSHAVRGLQVGDIVKGKMGGAAIRIKVEDASFEGTEVLVTRMFEAKYPNFQNMPGQMIIITGLKISEGPDTLTGELTRYGNVLSMGAAE